MTGGEINPIKSSRTGKNDVEISYWWHPILTNIREAKSYKCLVINETYGQQSLSLKTPQANRHWYYTTSAMAASILGCGALRFNRYLLSPWSWLSQLFCRRAICWVSSVRKCRLKKTKKAQEFERMRLANEQRLQRLNYEGLIELPRETVTQIRPHISGFTPPPSFRSDDGSNFQEFEVPNSQDIVIHRCHSVVSSSKYLWKKNFLVTIVRGNSIMW